MKIALLFAVVLSSTQLHAVEHKQHLPFSVFSFKEPEAAAFDFIRGHKQGKGHSIQWAMTTTLGVERFEVQYTYEDPTDIYSNWYTIGFINKSNEHVYKFLDRGILPGIINYRVTAVLTGGKGTITSDIYTTTIN